MTGRLTVAAALVVVTAATAGDRDLLDVARTRVEPLDHAARLADAPETAQAAYDAARELEEALRRAEPVSASCALLLRALRGYARSVRREAEGVDLPWPPQVESARTLATIERAAVDPAARRCRPAAVRAAASPRELESPQTGEAFFGDLRADAPAGAVSAVIAIGRRRFAAAVRQGRLAWRVPPTVRPGRYDVSVSFLAGTRRVGRRVSRRVWLLPRAARRAAPPIAADATLTAHLREAVRSFDGYSGIWVHDLATGRTAGWNEDARFPAASTVKLAVLIAGLRRSNAQPESSAVAYDLAALAGWSSNLATNRLLTFLGGSESAGADIAQRVLREIGATASTFTGGYRVGTASRGSPNPPPVVSGRLTTARDLGRVLFALHQGALGERRALRRLGLDRHGARVALGWLLSWTAPLPGDNVGDLKPSLPRGAPVAQKNGWFSSVRHTAAIVYGRRGPTIVVLLTYRSGMTLRAAQALGRRTVALLDLN